MWYPHHIDKAKKSIKKHLSAVHGVLEILDARLPYTSRAYEYKDLFLNKKRILIFNKIDIADVEECKKWKIHYKKQGYEVFMIDAKQMSIKKFFLTKIRKLFGKEYKEIRLMVVGIPNVGKSTIINSIKGKRSSKVGNEPGITKGIQWIKIGEEMRLLDTPGILYKRIFSKNVRNKLILIGSLKADEIEEEEAFVFGYELMRKRYESILKNVIEKEPPHDPFEFLNIYAKKRNFLGRGGILDISRALRTAMNEIKNGKWGKMTFEYIEDLEKLLKEGLS